MEKRESLERQIKRRTLPRLFTFLVFVVLCVFLIVAWAIHKNVERQHTASLNVFSANIEQRIATIRGEILSLAQNDLMINSLIDFQAREDYLDVFFQSFRLSNFSNASLVFFDFEGKVISSTRQQIYDKLETKPAWQQKVLTGGEEFLSIRDDGLIYVVPVFYSEFPEGALMAYLPDNQNTFSGTTNGISPDIILHLHDKETGEILFKSQPQEDEQDALPPTAYSKENDRFRLTSYQASISAYADLFTVAGAIGIIFVVVFFGSVVSIRLSAHTASRPLRDLENKLHSIRSTDKHLEILADDVSEVETLKHAYNTLFSDLDIASKSLADIENVVNSLNDYLLVLDSEAELILCNEPLRELLEELKINNDHLDGPALLTLIPKQVRTSKNSNIEAECSYGADRAGHQVFVRWKKQIYRDHQGQEAGALYVGTDTTHAREILEQLEIKNQAIESADTSIVITATTYDFPIVYVNAAFTKMTGYSSAEVLGRNCRLLQGPDTDPDARKVMREALRREEPASVKLLNYRKNGESFFVEVTLSPIRNQAGEVTHILGLQSDVSEAERTKRYLEEARAKAEESARLKSSFLASMSHEIRTPMNGVLGMLHLLGETPLDEQQSHHVHLAKTSADSLLDIINDILDFSKIEAGKMEIAESEFDLPEMLGDLVKSMSQRANERGDELLLDLSELEYRVVKSDPSRIKQITANLVTNAIKFTENGIIHISARIETTDQKAFLTLSVKDNGIGICPERQAAVFESFTQADNSTTRRFGGTGLGLAICKELCEALNGGISLESEENKGSHFQAKVQLGEIPDTAKAIRLPNLEGKHILVIDSSPAAGDLLQRTLAKTGADVRVFQDAKSAMESVLACPCDLVFLEHNLTDLDSSAFCQQLKADDREAPKCILMNDMSINVYPKGKISADAAFMKPATLDDIIASIETILNENPLEDADTAQMDSTQETSELKGMRVLLVEDNPINQLLAKTLLETMQLEVDVAGHGIEAINMLKQVDEDSSQKPYVAVFMDCQMPKMDGYEATACIRMGEAGEQFKQIPIIAMTANAVTGDREKCLDAGMDDYLSKPINIEALSERTLKWLGARER